MSSVQRDTVTVVIPTKNVAELLGPCLDSVAWADEILVIDMHSTDGTAELCANYSNVELIRREDYIFGNVNYGIDHARGDWVIRLDSDERITPELASEIQEILRRRRRDVSGFYFNQRLMVLGEVLRFGRGRASYRDMMFRTGTARYAVQREHEGLTASGAWAHAVGYYVHVNYRTIAEYLLKINYYTDRDTERLAIPSLRPSAFTGVVGAARAFHLYYLKQLGFRDGWVGLVDASMMAIYQFVQSAKIAERWDREHTRSGSLSSGQA